MSKVAIIANGGYLPTIGLKALILEKEPDAIVHIVDSISKIKSNLDQYTVIFSFLPIAGVKVVSVAIGSSEQEIRQIIDQSIQQGSATKRQVAKTKENNQLSKRELEVLRMVASGLINKEIAEQLHIGLQTVLSHRKHISQKLGIRTTSGFTAYAMMNGLI